MEILCIDLIKIAMGIIDKYYYAYKHSKFPWELLWYCL